MRNRINKKKDVEVFIKKKGLTGRDLNISTSYEAED